MSTSTAMPAAPLRLSTEETANSTPRSLSCTLSPSPSPAAQSKDKKRTPATPQFGSGPQFMAFRLGSASSLCTTPKRPDRAQSLPLDFASPDSSQKPKIPENLANKLDAVGKQLEEQLSLRGKKGKGGKAPQSEPSSKQKDKKASAKKKANSSNKSKPKGQQEPDSSQVPAAWHEGEEEEEENQEEDSEVPDPEHGELRETETENKDITFLPVEPLMFLA